MRYAYPTIRQKMDSMQSQERDSIGGSGAMCYVQNSLACYVLCTFLFTLLCEIKIGCYTEV